MITCLLFVAGTLQILGTLFTALVTVSGMKYVVDDTVEVDGDKKLGVDDTVEVDGNKKVVVTLKIRKDKLIMAQAGILMLLSGTGLSAIMSVVTAHAGISY